jgi:DNA-binding NarL/FixJ family response regulator
MLERLPDADAKPVRKKPRKADHAKIAELFKKGLSDKAIALKLGYSSAGAIRATRAKLGLRRPRRNPIDRAEVKRLFNEGKTIAQIAESMNYSLNYIKKILWLLYLNPGVTQG